MNRFSNNQTPVVNPNSPGNLGLDTLNEILQAAIGQYAVCEFLIGTTLLERREGVLYSAGVNYFTLYQREEDRYLVCDLYSLKFLYLYQIT